MDTNSPASISVHPAFEWLRSEPIASLNITIEEYRHKKTGAQHYHIAADNAENVFLVALRTVPHDSTGVAHILEHTVLCGSEKYPVRDPFFMMIRRSLNTFMNAFTSSDWTAYPFASQNRKDFNNLLNVYLDAVFFSRLDPLDFAQEGHRIEFETPDDPNSLLVYKGVVFNEMKGAMSSVTSTLWHTLCHHLFPTTTYHYNSGGEPSDIPNLTYDQLKEFYRTHYHPSNAIFMTYGDTPVAELHEKFEAQALNRFEKLDEQITVDKEQRYSRPIRVEEHYAFDEPDNCDNKNHVVFGWLLGESASLEDNLRAQLLSGILLDNSASPLQRALETTDLGSAPSPLCGLEDSNRELIFVCGLEGAEAQSVDTIEALVSQTLEKVGQDGVDLAQVEAVLHQLELHQREIGGDGYPYGLQIIMTALGSATHRGDPVALLNLDPVLEKLRQQIRQPNFVQSLVRELLIDNPHQVRLLLKPDPQLSKQRDNEEAGKLQTIKNELDDSGKRQVIDLANALAERQQQVDDDSVLPKVTLDDVPTEIKNPVAEPGQAGSLPSTWYSQGTNGLSYEQIIINTPALDEQELLLLPYYSDCLTELGVGELSYLETQNWQSAICGGFNAYSTLRGTIADHQQVDSYFTLSSKALSRNHEAVCELMQTSLDQVRFDELQRIREIVAQQRARREQGVTGNGHALAMNAAQSGLGPAAQLSHKLSGLAGLQSLKKLDASLDNDQALEQLASQLQCIHQKFLAAPRQFLSIGETEKRESYTNTLDKYWSGPSINSDAFKPLQLQPISQQTKQFWQANSQVNFCAKAFPTVAPDHPDAAALTVLGGFLRNGFLHRSIREQGGAYGGGASQDSGNGAFRFFSYRDPRLTETLDDFDQSVQWLLNENHKWQAVEEAILGVIGTLDKPASPAGEARKHFHNTITGRSDEFRNRFRQRVLETKLDDLQRVGRSYLLNENASIAVLTHRGEIEQLQDYIKSNNIDVLSL
jgi:Zn-dependent M16 (insulinase) family peptidase